MLFLTAVLYVCACLNFYCRNVTYYDEENLCEGMHLCCCTANYSNSASMITGSNVYAYTYGAFCCDER